MMEFTVEELNLLHKILDKATGRAQDPQITVKSKPRFMDPLTEALVDHQPISNTYDKSWACTCTASRGYVSQVHVIDAHIGPIVEKAATQKIREILDRAGMDLDIIVNTDKIFGEGVTIER